MSHATTLLAVSLTVRSHCCREVMKVHGTWCMGTVLLNIKPCTFFFAAGKWAGPDAAQLSSWAGTPVIPHQWLPNVAKIFLGTPE